jgi:hypothetical protein
MTERFLTGPNLVIFRGSMNVRAVKEKKLTLKNCFKYRWCFVSRLKLSTASFDVEGAWAYSKNINRFYVECYNKNWSEENLTNDQR